MKKLFNPMSLWLALNLSVLLCLGGCSDDNDPIGGGGGTVGELVFDWKVESDAGDPVLLLSDETYVVSYHAEGVESISLVDVPAGWQVTVDEEAGNVTVAAPSSSVEADKNYTLQLVVAGADNQSITTEGVNFYHVTFDEPEGAFVLNEGNMTTENGSLVYITPEGYVVDDAYKRVNGTELGNVAQDMCFYDGKIYIISQNGDTNAVGSSFENDGMLVVADAVTLKKLRSFTNEELSQLDWPTHIAVIDEQHVYIRDNAGVWCLNMDDQSLSFVDGTENAPKARLATVNNEVYFPLSGSYMAYVKKIAPSTGQVSSVGTDAIFSASTMINYILGIAPADDGNLWIIATSAFNPDREGMITLNKLDLATSELAQNRLSEQPDDAYNCCFAAYGNTVYYADGTIIYRAEFDAGKDGIVDEPLVDLADLDDNVGLLYNGLGVHPVTGHVYVNTLKGFGNFFTTNSIWEFDFAASMDTPVHKFDNYTHFPAGVFFNQ